MKHKLLPAIFAIGCLAGLWIGLAGLLLAAPPPATGPDDATCLGCHDGYDKTLANSPHRLSSEMKSPAIKVGCINCHAGGEHHADDPSATNITNPGRLSGRKLIDVCSQCHVAHQELDNYGFDAHTNLEVKCTDCHKVHNYNHGLLLDDKAQFCQRCHEETVSSFRRRSNHPVRQGVLTCLSCHRFTKRLDANLTYDLGRTCQDCHTDQAGPFPHEHDVVNAYSVDGRGCIECHEPHGSENDKLLRQPVAQLCMQCHVVPGHATAHDGIYAQHNCLTCHTDIHGSYSSAVLLDANIQARFGTSCYCHDRIQ